MKHLPIIFIIVSLCAVSSYSQYGTNSFLVNFNANYTTTAKIYLNPYSSDIDVKNRYLNVEDIFSPSIDIRYKLSEEIIIGLSSEYLKSDVNADLSAIGPNGIVSVVVKEGYDLIPIELSAFYLLPFSTEHFKFQLGGGLGYYIGNRFKKFGDASVSTVKREFAFGIQAITTCDFLINEFLSVRGEMKFRDPEFELHSKYDNTTINYDGIQIKIPKQEFDSKVNIDGITFTLGIGLSF